MNYLIFNGLTYVTIELDLEDFLAMLTIPLMPIIPSCHSARAEDGPAEPARNAA